MWVAPVPASFLTVLLFVLEDAHKMSNTKNELPIAKFLRRQQPTDEEIMSRWKAREGLFGVKLGMTEAEVKALGLPKKLTGMTQKLFISFTKGQVREVVYSYLEAYHMGEAFAAALTERYGEPRGGGKRWDCEEGRYTIKSIYRAAPGFWDVTLKLSAKPEKSKAKSKTKAARRVDTPESLAAELTEYLRSVAADVYDKGAIDRVLVSEAGNRWAIEVIALGEGDPGCFEWSERLHQSDGALAPELIEALVDAGGVAIDAVDPEG
jgi:hypothetical protein